MSIGKVDNMDTKGFVYILKSSNCKRYYIGSSINPQKRLIKHNNGQVVATRDKGPWSICLVQGYKDIKTARRIEKKIKKFKSRILLERMIKDCEIKVK